MLSSFGKFKKQYSKLHRGVETRVILKKYTKAVNLLNFGNGVKRYRFYDDDHINIEKVSQDRRIECILVQRRQMSDGTIGREDFSDISYQKIEGIPPKTYFEHLISTYNLMIMTPDNKPTLNEEHKDLFEYMKHMRKHVLQPAVRFTEYNEKHVSESFDINMINECRQWAQNLYNQESQKNVEQEFYGCVFFDFDRVLNCPEGIAITETIEQLRTLKIELSGIVKYFVGSPERLQHLRDLFRDLESKKIKLYILTNNSACGPRPAFKKLIQELYAGFSDSNILCCRSISDGKLECIYLHNALIRPTLLSLKPFVNRLRAIEQGTNTNSGYESETSTVYLTDKEDMSEANV